MSEVWNPGEEFLGIMGRRGGKVWVKGDSGWQAFPNPEASGEHLSGQVTPPPSLMGKTDEVFDATTNRRYKNLDEYKESVDEYHRGVQTDYGKTLSPLDTPVKKAVSLLTGKLTAETDIINSLGDEPIELNEDTTHNYLLWSVPLHTGKHLQNKLVGSTLKDVSGEAAAQDEAEKGKGYMMKQTLEHLEALSALVMMQGDEKLQPKDIVSQYGSTDSAKFDTKKVDPLHHPRDPVSHGKFVEILKVLEDGLSKTTEQAPLNVKEIATALRDKLSDNRLAELGGLLEGVKAQELTLLQESDPVNPRTIGEKLNKKFMEEFFANGMADKVFADVDEDDNEDRAPKWSPGDDEQEVTRAPLKDGDFQLVGGRQAQFDSIWEPKSTEVITKAAERNDAVTSHGWLYHRNPKNTVQAKAEFPAYLNLMKELFDKENDPTLQDYFKRIIESIEEILNKVQGIDEQGENETLEQLAVKRDKVIREINGENDKIVEAVGELRDYLTKKPPGV